MAPEPALLAHAESLTTACGRPEDAGAVCATLFRLTGRESVAQAGDLFLARPTKALLVLVLAMVVARMLRRTVRRLTGGLTRAAGPDVVGEDRSAGSMLRTGGVTSERTVQRAQTVGALLSSVGTFTVWTVAALVVLGEFGIELGPLLAGAGIVGIAIGFGAQHLVRDFLAGIFMLLEDQYGVGDVIDAGPASGTVEGLSLRTTRLRDVEGNVWHIPNGQIAWVANKSQDWSRALLDLQVSYRTNSDRAIAVIQRVADEATGDPELKADVMARPEVWGVEELGPDGMTVRLVVQTRPLAQWRVGRALRARMKAALEAEGIEIPFPQRAIWVRDGPATDLAAPDRRRS